MFNDWNEWLHSGGPIDINEEQKLNKLSTINESGIPKLKVLC